MRGRQATIVGNNKQCSKCGLLKLFSDFDSETRKKCGLSSTCKECRKTYFRVWRKTHGEQSTRYTTEYRRRHKEKYNARVRVYRKGRSHVWDHNRRARELGAGSYTLEEWNEILNFYENKCLACGGKERIVVDHVIPLSCGGSNTKDNLQPLCFWCNSKKHAKTIDYRTGYTINR